MNSKSKQKYMIKKFTEFFQKGYRLGEKQTDR